MRFTRLFFSFVVLAIATCGLSARSVAAGPRNPYSSFNLSGINYGAQQWDRAQQQGRRVWPYYNTPSRGSSRGSTMTVGGFANAGGAVIQAGSVRSNPRVIRRWRR
jgi:hypothetical protein